jgi:hypothetical protein
VTVVVVVLVGAVVEVVVVGTLVVVVVVGAVVVDEVGGREEVVGGDSLWVILATKASVENCALRLGWKALAVGKSSESVSPVT